MSSPDYSEAEIQVLIVLIELAEPVETPNNNFYRFYPKNVEEAAHYFKGFREDWGEACESLVHEGLIEPGQGWFVLTPQGLSAARLARADRPPIWYWYKEYYTLTAYSQVYAEFCTRLYGLNLCQTNFSDMEQLGKLIEVLSLQPGQRALDLGCGKGLIDEYISDTRGASILGIDYSPEAILQALHRTQAKRHRLDFQTQNMDHLALPSHSFDAVISVDTLYMPRDLDETIEKLADLLKPGGQMGLFYMHTISEPDASRESLQAGCTPLALSLKRNGLGYQSWDFSAQTYRHMQRKRRIGEALRPAFEAEGTLALYHYIINESEGSLEPYDPEKATLARYLYHVRV